MAANEYEGARILGGTDRPELFWAEMPDGSGGYVTLVVGQDGKIEATAYEEPAPAPDPAPDPPAPDPEPTVQPDP